MPIDAIIDQLPDVLTGPQAHRIGVSKRQLYAWRDAGIITPIGRGLFMKTGVEGDPDLIEIAARAPSATLCLASALARHGLTDEIPASVHVAIERGRRPPRTAAPVTWHRFDVGTLAVDRREFEVAAGYKLGLYGPTRSVIDVFRLRHIEGQDAAIEALRQWIRQRGNQPSTLLRMVRRHFPLSEKSIRSALEVLL